MTSHWQQRENKKRSHLFCFFFFQKPNKHVQNSVATGKSSVACDGVVNETVPTTNTIIWSVKERKRKQCKKLCDACFSV